MEEPLLDLSHTFPVTVEGSINLPFFADIFDLYSTTRVFPNM